MQAYMNSVMPFWGVAAPARRLLVAQVAAQLAAQMSAHNPVVDGQTLFGTVSELWHGATHREERYAALDLLRRPALRKLMDLRWLPALQEMILTGPWWDHNDETSGQALPWLLQRHPLGACRTWGVEAKFGPSEDSFCRVCRPIAVAMGQKAGVHEVRRSQKWTAAAELQPTIPKSDRLLEVKAVLRPWARSDSLWLRRAAMLSQRSLTGSHFDAVLLYDCILPSAGSSAMAREFFIRKGMGWALRERSYAAPEEVQAFCVESRSQLSRRRCVKRCASSASAKRLLSDRAGLPVGPTMERLQTAPAAMHASIDESGTDSIDEVRARADTAPLPSLRSHDRFKSCL